MRIPSGKTDQLIFFVAVDSTDLKTRKTGLTSFTVYRSRNGGAATVYTTPTVAELSAANMPGVYSLAIDEDTTVASTSDSEEYCVHITQASMAPVTRVIELYRRDTTSGNTAAIDSSGRIDIGKALGTAVTLDANSVLNVSAKYLAGTALTGRDIGASVLLSSGAGTGQLDFTSGVVKSNATQWVGGTIPAVNVTGVPLVDLKYTLGTVSPATAGSVRADAVTGAVGSVTGAVGSVTGAVGSVTGAVGSVTGAVGSVAGNVGGNVVGSVGSVTGRVTANTDQWAGGTIPAVNVTGVPLVDLKYTLGTISPATAGSVRADSVTGAVGSVTGSVGSVTGAVGSVTGSVGSVAGNVVGSVASVTARVTANVDQVNGVTVDGTGTDADPWGPT